MQTSAYEVFDLASGSDELQGEFPTLEEAHCAVWVKEPCTCCTGKDTDPILREAGVQL